MRGFEEVEDGEGDPGHNMISEIELSGMPTTPCLFLISYYFYIASDTDVLCMSNLFLFN